MSHLSYLLLFPPICFLSFLVISACNSDDPKVVLKTAFKHFMQLTGAFVIGGLAIFFINKYL